MLHELVSEMGYKSAYIAAEQRNSATFQQTIRRIGLQPNPNMEFYGDMDDPRLDLRNLRFIFIDSKDSARITVTDFRKMKEDYPDLTIILTSQSNKDATYRGDGTWRNEVEVVLKGEMGTIRVDGKNRFGGNGELKVY